MTRTQRGLRASVASLAIGVAAILGVAWAAPTGAASTVPCHTWKGFHSPLIQGGFVVAGSGTSSSDVWAVGGDGLQPVIEHWGGTRWKLVPSPSVTNVLDGVTAITPTDAWAVGVNGASLALMEHWDGISWTQADVPTPGTYSFLYAIDSTSATDVWAVGTYQATDATLHGLAEHWDGTIWSLVPVPDSSPYANVFYSVTAIAHDDVWAAGYQQTNGVAFQPFIEHWDGTAWAVVQPARPPSGDTNFFFDVDGVASDDVWAVGSYQSSQTESKALMEHWDGTSWGLVPAGGSTGPMQVEAVSSSDVWAVGNTFSHAVTWHWDGSSWKQLGTPSPGISDSAVLGLTAISSSDIWAFGAFTPKGFGDASPLTMHSTGPCP